MGWFDDVDDFGGYCECGKFGCDRTCSVHQEDDNHSDDDPDETVDDSQG